MLGKHWVSNVFREPLVEPDEGGGLFSRSCGMEVDGRERGREAMEVLK